MLLLFTSNKMLRETVERCREALPDMTILSQGDAPNPVLQRRFLAEEHSCLFATRELLDRHVQSRDHLLGRGAHKIPFPGPLRSHRRGCCGAGW